MRSHYVYERFLILYWALGNMFHWNCNKNTKTLIESNSFKNVVLFSLILDSSVGLSAAIQSVGNSVPKTLVPIIEQHWTEEDNSSAFDSIIACLCQTIEMNKKKHVYCQSQVRNPTGSGVEWAECSLIIGTGCRVQVFSLILDSSVGLSAGIQSAGDSVPKT